MSFSKYCSVVSSQRGDNLAGTASRVDYWLLLEYHATFPGSGIAGTDIPTPVQEHLALAAQTLTNTRVQLIQKTDSSRDGYQFFIVNAGDTEPWSKSFRLSAYEDILSLDLIGETKNKHTERGILHHSPIFLICTNGRKDPCCGKFGYPAYEALEKTIQKENVWQTTHVGGDKFAGNMVCLPHGLYYGRVTPENGLVIATSYTNGTLPLDGFRGRSTLQAVDQVAEGEVRQRLDLKALDDIEIRTSRSSEQNAQVLVYAQSLDKHFLVDVEVHKKTIQQPTCLGSGEGTAMVYSVVQVTEK